MTTDKQITANRKNALKSTGPSTELGKSFSSVNATKHGLRSRQVVIEGESQREFDDFRLMIIEHYAPADPIEASLVDRVTVCLWRLRRTETIEAQIFDNLREDMIADQRKNNPNPLVITLPPDPADSPTQETLQIRLGLLLLQVLQQYYEFQPDPQIASTISRMKAAIKYMRENPNIVYVPGLRRYLQGIREIFADSEFFSDDDLREIDEGIEYLLDFEKQAAEENQPNIGHAVTADITTNNVLTKLTRYESQIQSSLFKAMHELQRLQKTRQ